jgi:2,4-dienoyl-CoA reductase-like NADH-dependent reductase (Old Yellow Enzyme family)
MEGPGVSQFPHLFQPIKVGPTTLKNRVTLSGHQPRLAQDSLVTDAYVEYQRARARSGVAMQSTGLQVVVKEALAATGSPRLANVDDRIIPGYAKIAEAVHAEGGKFLAQLGHMGPAGSPSDMIVLSPSRVVSELTRGVAKPMTEAEILHMIDQFEVGAARCRKGNLDGCELHLYTGTLLIAFLSPYTNKRSDQWGGSLENRMRFPLAALEAIRRGIGKDRILGIKLTVDEYVEGGIDIDLGVQLARRFAESGLIDYIAVTVGNNLVLRAEKRDRYPTGTEHGEFRPQCRAVKKAVGDLPVMYIGGVTDLQMAEDIVASGDADMVSMVRAFIADADHLSKAVEGRMREIRPCIHANVCINVTQARRAVACISNPEVGQEAKWQKAFALQVPARRTAVLGGGPGGVEAARTLARFGHHVTLFERESSLGGQMLRYTEAKYLREARDVLDWWEHQLALLKVDVRLGAAATADDVLALEPDFVVDATGSVPLEKVIPSPNGTSIKQVGVWEALKGVPATTAVIVDEMGRSDAFQLAERLAETATHVHIVTSCTHVGEGEGLGTLPPALVRMGRLGVSIIERARPSRLEGSTVHIEDMFEGRPRSIENVDLLVTWAGGVSATRLADDLRAAGLKVEAIGDALQPRRVYDAVYEGAEAARIFSAELSKAVDV